VLQHGQAAGDEVHKGCVAVAEYLVPPQRQLTCSCQILDAFLTSTEGIDLYADRLIRKYMRYVNFHVK